MMDIKNDPGMNCVHVFKSFESPVYRIFFASLLGDMMASNMQIMARSLLIYRLTDSPIILGAVSFAHALPMLLFSIFGGVLADRKQKRSILFVGNVLSVGLSLCIGLSLTLGYLSAERPGSWWILIVAAVFQGTIMALTMPSRHSIIPEIVGTELVMNATSLRVMGMNTMRIFGPAIAGFLIDSYGFEVIYYVLAGLYTASAILIYCFLPVTRVKVIYKRNALNDVQEGLKYVRHNTVFLFILCFSLFATILTMPYQTLLPIFTDDIFKIGATGLGILNSVFGIGAIIGSIIIASLSNKKRGLLMLCNSFILGLVLAAFSFSVSWHFSLIFIALVGLTHTVRITLTNTLLQYYVDEKYLGRVMSIHMMEFGIMGFGTFIAGLLADIVGVQWTLGSFGMMLTFVSILALTFVPRIRKLA